ncbi:MAG TPA: hypothetical protein VEG36_03745 [Burkholderiales bacterium]|nr:hypothetical protein [Burkholderiales bacterium]
MKTCASSASISAGGAPRPTRSATRLAGQVASYLVAQLKNFGTRRRTNDNEVMHAIEAMLAEGDMRDVAEYLSSLD